MAKTSENYGVSKAILIYKFILGLLELLLGLGIIIFGKQITLLYDSLVTQELLEDPHDLLGNLTETYLPYLFEHRGYVVLILSLLGVGKMLGAGAMFYRKHWGLDILVGITILLLPFEFYNLISQPSLTKFSFLIINILISLYLVNFKPHKYFTNLKSRY